MYFYTTLFQAGFSLIKFYIFLIFCRKASLNIHESMMKKIIGAPLSFFDNHFVGNVLNRFSFDCNNIDEHLPFIFPQLTGVSILLCYVYCHTEMQSNIHQRFQIFISHSRIEELFTRNSIDIL